MVYPTMRMDYARRRKYALLACCMHGASAMFIFLGEANDFLTLPLLIQGITRFVAHRRAAGYVIALFPYITAMLQMLTFAIHVYSIIAFAEQRYSYSRWNPRNLMLLMLGLIASLGCSLLITVIVIIHYRKFDRFLAIGIAQHMVGFGVLQSDREKMNWLQGFFECCGVFGYEDWLPLTATNDLVESNLLTNGKNQWLHCTKNGCYMPHSCCMNGHLKCSPRILLQNFTKNEEVGQHRAKEWFYPTGCLEGVKGKLITILPLIFSIFNLVLQFITLLYSQIACTSYYVVGRCNAHDATAILPAWILPFPRPYPEALIQKCQERLKQGRDFQEITI